MTPSSESLFIGRISRNDSIFDIWHVGKILFYKSNFSIEKFQDLAGITRNITTWQLWKFQVHAWKLIELYNTRLPKNVKILN